MTERTQRFESEHMHTTNSGARSWHLSLHQSLPVQRLRVRRALDRLHLQYGLNYRIYPALKI